MTEEEIKKFSSMDIYSPPGSKVVYKGPVGGYPGDKVRAERHLKAGQIYTIKHLDVHSYSTDVYLEEVTEQAFNSVLFDNV